MTDMLSIQDMNSVLNEVGLSSEVLDLIKSKLHEKVKQQEQTTEYVYRQLAKEYDENYNTCINRRKEHYRVIRDYFANKASGGTDTFYITQKQKNDIIGELEIYIEVSPKHVVDDLHKEIYRIKSKCPVYWKV
jgi:hypothetical protein